MDVARREDGGSKECRAYGLSTKANVIGEGTIEHQFIEADDSVILAD